ncbi:hypothetical protein EMCRGX_G000020 [Ephydatia muelleri]
MLVESSSKADSSLQAKLQLPAEDVPVLWQTGEHIEYLSGSESDSSSRIGCNANTYYDLYFFLALERNECHRAQIVNIGANVTESGFLPNVETKQN